MPLRARLVARGRTMKRKDIEPVRLAWRGLLALACGMAIAPMAQAAIPASETQALINLYVSTNGSGWNNSTGWGGPAGTECDWYGVYCDEARSHVIYIELPANNLSGQLPSLSGLTDLVEFYVPGNRIGGQIPSLSSLTKLEDFEIEFNDFSGTIPSLSGLTSLQYFDVMSNRINGKIPSLSGLSNLWFFRAADNNLTGSIPSLAGLTSLAHLRLGTNQLSGVIPDLSQTPSLVYVHLSENKLSGSIPSLSGMRILQVFEVAENQLTGEIPPLDDLVSVDFFSAWNNQLTGEIPPLGGLEKATVFQVNGNHLSGSIPSMAGMAKIESFNVQGNELDGNIPSLEGLLNLRGFYASNNALTGEIPSLSGLSDLEYFLVSENDLTGEIPPLDGLTNLRQFDVSWNHLTGDVPAVPDAGQLSNWKTLGWIFSRSALCPNALAHTDNADWDAATGEAPWYQNCVEPGSQTTLNQHGISGSWAFASVDSQGFVLEVIPDMIAPGEAYLFAGWFTFDVEGNQRWYTVEGSAGNDDNGASLTIYGYHGGSFATTQPAARVAVGSAQLLASDCMHGVLTYSFDDGTSGSIPLTRLSANANCSQEGDNGAVGRQLLSGGWADVSNNDSQGLVFDVDMTQNVFFGAWYTFLPDADPAAGYETQHWYTFQAIASSADFTELPDVGIYDTTGGFFMQHVVPPPVTDQVGSASLTFHSCSSATLQYQFASGPNAGRTGTLELSHVGPQTQGCML